jgi:hypothetical protein
MHEMAKPHAAVVDTSDSSMDANPLLAAMSRVVHTLEKGEEAPKPEPEPSKETLAFEVGSKQPQKPIASVEDGAYHCNDVFFAGFV